MNRPAPLLATYLAPHFSASPPPPPKAEKAIHGRLTETTQLTDSDKNLADGDVLPLPELAAALGVFY